MILQKSATCFEIVTDALEYSLHNDIINQGQWQTGNYVVYFFNPDLVQNLPDGRSTGIVDMQSGIVDESQIVGKFVIQLQTHQVTFIAHAFKQGAGDTAIARPQLNDTSGVVKIDGRKQAIDQHL